MGLGLNIDQATASALIGGSVPPAFDANAIRPLNRDDLDFYNQSGDYPISPHSTEQQSVTGIPEITDLADGNELQLFLQTYYPSLSNDFNPLADPASITTLHFKNPLDYFPSSPESSNQSGTDNQAGNFRDSNFLPDYLLQQNPETNSQISADQFSQNLEEPDLPPGIIQGSYFTMAQDSSLRFLPSALTHEFQQGSHYSSSAEDYTLISMSNPAHGRIVEDANGDIRFFADQDFFIIQEDYSLDGAGNITFTLEEIANFAKYPG